MAWAHMHSDLAALDCFATASGVKAGSCVYFSSFLITLSGMLSLSKPSSRGMNWLSLSTFFAVSQSAFSCSSVHTASMVVCTSGGGLGKDLISVMSALLSELSDVTALLSAGIALSRSACASSLMACVSAACTLTIASSAATRSFTICASALSLFTWIISSAVALLFSSSTGCSSPRSIFILSIMTLVSLSLLSPLSRRSRAMPYSSRFSPSSATYRLMRSRYDLGVV
mmetsp:Transcript_27060/g.59034  ORF Transcript_27060/g.59034 Transcript_27060/m.59034 type:complete len:228 (+) Transcript_27060:1458-2141(+)